MAGLNRGLAGNRDGCGEQAERVIGEELEHCRPVGDGGLWF